MPRIGNENLLNGLKEGVFVMDETSNFVVFQNKAARSLNNHHNVKMSLSLLDANDYFDMSKKQFADLNTTDIFKSDSNQDYQKI